MENSSYQCQSPMATSDVALWLHQMSRTGIKFTYQPTSEMAAGSLTKGLGASRLPQIKEDLCLVDD